jgi:hypothetical protein
MSGTELSRVRTEFRLPLLEPINKSPLESNGAGVVMQSLRTRDVWQGTDSDGIER